MFHSFGSLVSRTYQHTKHKINFWYGSKDQTEDGGKTIQNLPISMYRSREKTDSINLVPQIQEVLLELHIHMIRDLRCINYKIFNCWHKETKPETRIILAVGSNRNHKKLKQWLTRRWQYRLLNTAVLVNPNMEKHHTEELVSRSGNFIPFFWQYSVWLWFIWQFLNRQNVNGGHDVSTVGTDEADQD